MSILIYTQRSIESTYVHNNTSYQLLSTRQNDVVSMTISLQRTTCKWRKQRTYPAVWKSASYSESGQNNAPTRPHPN